MAGYKNFSMSNNAAAAYADGLKPKTKFIKDDFLSVCYELKDSEKAAVIEKASIKELRNNLLSYSEWHHTGSYYNKTNFYIINDSLIEDLTADELKELLKPEQQEEEKPQHVRFIYLEWSGTRKHPKATERTADGVRLGNWITYADSDGRQRKKNVFSNGVKILDYLEN